MSKEVVAEVIALIELGLIAPEDIVKCLRKANSEPEKALAEQPAQQEPFGFAVMENPIAPPVQRTWVGLTDEEIEKFTVELRDIPVTLAFAIEAKLRSKNEDRN